MKRLILLGIPLMIMLVGCGTGEADVDFDANTDTTTLAYDDQSACTTGLLSGDSSNCGVTATVNYTAEETSGKCTAKDVKLTFTYTYPNGTTQEVETDFGDIEPGGDKTKTVSVHFSDATALSGVTSDGDADFESDCGGLITGQSSLPI